LRGQRCRQFGHDHAAVNRLAVLIQQLHGPLAYFADFHFASVSEGFEVLAVRPFHGTVCPAQPDHHVRTGFHRGAHTHGTQVIAIGENDIALPKGGPFQQLRAVLIGQLKPVAAQTEKIERIVHAPFRPFTGRTLYRGAIDGPGSQAARQSRLLAKPIAQLQSQPGQPRRRCSQPLQQGHL